MRIPLLDLTRQYDSISENVNQKVIDVLHSGKYILGENVNKFEEEFARDTGVKHAIGVGNGTDALVIALEALGIGQGDEVITSPFTYFATAESISMVGAKPVFVDVDPRTYNIDPEKIEEKITDKTKAIMPVHIFGLLADMDRIMEIAEKHNLYVIEDAAQASGAEYKGKKAGSFGHLSCFSFFPTKNLGCAGDGGMITTNDDDLNILVRALRAHGSGETGQRAYNIIHNLDDDDIEEDSGDENYNPLKYYNYLIGYNSRLDEVQAVILREKLKNLDNYNGNRRKFAQQYNEALANSGLVTPYEPEGYKHIYHQYIIQSENREDLISHLDKAGISTGVYYPIPLHLQVVYREEGYKEGDLPNAEYLSFRTLALPVFPELTQEEVSYIIETLLDF